MFKTRFITATLLAASLAAPVAAWSQTASSPNGGGNSTGGAQSEKEKQTLPLAQQDPAAQKDVARQPDSTAPQQSADGMDSSSSRRARVEERIADLHATLKITPAQEKMFDGFAQVMLDNAQAMDTRIGKTAADQSRMTAEQSLKSYAMITEEHARSVKRLSNAFDKLYAELTPSQRMAADEAFRTASADRQMRQQKTGG